MSNYRVIDNAFPLELIERANAQWPDEVAPWVYYRTEEQRKRTLGCRRIGGMVLSDWPTITEPCCALLRHLLELDVAGWLDLSLCPRPVPDTLLWGAGLHAMGRGDHLGMHLDADRHPLTGLERRANAILFVHPFWHADWGGAFRLAGCEPIECKPGRLILFETTDSSIHGVPDRLWCPQAIERRSLAVYWWGMPRGPAKRSQAEFATSNPNRHDVGADLPGAV